MSRFVLQVSAGTGPEEACRFAVALAAQLEATCRTRGLTVEEVVERARSVELHLVGDAATRLSDELGTHALIARSARRGRAARKRWFASVTLHPTHEEASARIESRDLVITSARAGGPGGQRVNKVATAVRVVHSPSGIAVRAAEERSRGANLRRALDRIAGNLAARGAEERAAAGRSRRLAHYRVERGAPVRTWRTGRDGALEPI